MTELGLLMFPFFCWAGTPSGKICTWATIGLVCLVTLSILRLHLLRQKLFSGSFMLW